MYYTASYSNNTPHKTCQTLFKDNSFRRYMAEM